MRGLIALALLACLGSGCVGPGLEPPGNMNDSRSAGSVGAPGASAVDGGHKTADAGASAPSSGSTGGSSPQSPVDAGMGLVLPDGGLEEDGGALQPAAAH